MGVLAALAVLAVLGVLGILAAALAPRSTDHGPRTCTDHGMKPAISRVQRGARMVTWSITVRLQ